MADIIIINSQKIDPALLQQATRVLRQGGLLIYPTETFYALGADYSNWPALQRLLKVKGRSQNHPLPLILSRPDEIEIICAQLRPEELISQLIRAFWPGPLTLVLPAAPGLHQALLSAPIAPDGLAGVAMRLSSNPIAMALARSLGRAIVSTSANPTGHPPCQTVKTLNQTLLERVDLVIDGGECVGQKPSTILELRQGPPYRVLRPGAITLPETWLM